MESSEVFDSIYKGYLPVFIFNADDGINKTAIEKLEGKRVISIRNLGTRYHGF